MSLSTAQIANGKVLADKILTSLTTLTTRYSTDADMATLAAQCNAAAAMIATAEGLPVGTFNGQPGPVNPDTGGIPCQPR